LCLPAVWPYLGGDIPRSNDSLTHLYRAVELDRLVRSGDLFPRWGPDFAHGYGAPVFNYFSYFSHYLIVLFHFTGLSFLWSLRATYIVAILGAGLSAFGLGSVCASSLVFGSVPNGRGFGGKGLVGLVTAVGYVYSPYLLYTANVRGGLPESLALAFLPLALWGVIVSLRPRASGRQLGSAAVAVLAIAGFIASHVGMAIQYLPLLALFILYFAITNSFQSDHKSFQKGWLGFWGSPVVRGLGLGFGILFFGLALTAVLWLPSVAELSYVQFETAFARAGLVYTENFSRLEELFAYPSLPIYTHVLNPPIIRSLSVPAAVLALSGLLLIRRFSRWQQITYLFWLVTFSGLCFLTLDLSKPIWDSIGLLQRSTFPWRFLGPASLILAVLAGIAINNWLWVASSHTENWGIGRIHFGSTPLWAFGILVLGIFSAPFLFPPREPSLDNPTLADLARFEIPPLLVATTTTGEYTPIWVKEFPDTSHMRTAIVNGDPPERLAALDAVVTHLTAEPSHDAYRLTTAQTVTVTYRSFYFPGWQATLDDRPLEITPSDPNGLITFTVPAGEHTLDIRFGSTPIRTLAGWISVIALAVIGLLVVGLFTWRTSELENLERSARWDDFNRKLVTGLLVIFYCLLFIVSLFIINSDTPQTQNPLNLDFGGELTLVGYNQSKIKNQSSKIDLIWQAQHPLGVPYGFNVRLSDDRGLVYSDTNIERPRDWRFYPGTDFWQPGQFILDSYILTPFSGTPPGSYQLEVIAYRADTLQSLATQVIGEYQIESPTNEPLADPILILDGLTLIDVQADRTDAAPGDQYRLTLRWQAVIDSPSDQTTQLELIDSAGAVVYTRTETISPTYVPSRWKVGDVLSQEVFFRLPARLLSGDFHWRVGGVELKAPAAVTLNLHAPPRSFDIPTLTHPQMVELTPSVKLLGWNESLVDLSLTIELAWQATREMSESDRVFLHLLDADGNLVSQSDGEPANWSRPTTGWLPGEVVMDARTLMVPGAGVYTLEVGWVNEAGERVAEPLVLGELRAP
jgi:hypothetical protein